MGMALKSEFGEEAFGVWDEWSQKSQSYRASSAKACWRSFGGGKIHIGTLFHEAGKAGWHRSGREVAANREEIAERRRELKKRAEAEALKRQKEHEEAAERAKALLARATQDTHPYLRSKQFPDELGFVTEDNSLLIPLRDEWKKLVGAQVISRAGDEWVKKFIYGTKASGAVFRIGSRAAAHTILCEGYATGLTIHKAASMTNLDVTVLVCFSAHNIVAVSKLVKTKYCGIYADNDENKAGEEAALKARKPYIMSNTVGFDANDDMREYGIIHVAKKVGQLIQNMK
jgi:putative DNA primase/helicase